MLVIGLFFAVILLIGTGIASRKPSTLIPTSFILGLICCAAPLALGVFAYVLWEFAAAIALLAGVVAQSDRRRLFIPLSAAALVLVFGINSAIAWSEIKFYQAQYPFESIEERLPARPMTEAKLPAKVESHVSYWEGSRVFGFNLNYREIHENAVKIFINRPNFGQARMSGFLGLGAGQNRKESIPQPGTRSVSASVAEEVGKAIPVEPDLETLHQNSAIYDFLSLSQFGYFKDRRHVAGFPSHQFRSVPEPGKRWKLQALDLVGLVVHDKPVVYISENLPRMDELRQAPLRELNAFESAGLKELRAGEEIFVREMPDQSVRMLGALRAMKQCINCHGGARGDLLGAFSYELRKE